MKAKVKCMRARTWVTTNLLFLTAVAALQPAHARDLKINIPRRSILTPVQRLNREGVEALQKHKLEKAEQLFYKAYLYDPENSFTLNNLGYVSELEGQLERARQFYALAAAQPSDAVVDIASEKRVKGLPMRSAMSTSSEPLLINHDNVEAVRLLSQGRSAEADVLLQEALKKDPLNVFTLNNLGAAKEMEGEKEQALSYYDRAAKAASDASAVVTANRAWRGHQVTRMAEENAATLRTHLSHENDVAQRVAELNLRGVSAVNRHDMASAEQDFRKAYALDPNNAFSLNNIGYVAEMEGDRETAQFFYEKARQAMGSEATVGVASSSSAEGKRLGALADESFSQVQARVSQQREEMRRQGGPVVLRHRDNSPVEESVQPGTSQVPQ